MTIPTPELVTAAIAVVTPLVIAGAKKLAPILAKAKWAGPSILASAPLVGLLLSYLPPLIGVEPGSAQGALIAGALGVWVREAYVEIKAAAFVEKPDVTL